MRPIVRGSVSGGLRLCSLVCLLLCLFWLLPGTARALPEPDPSLYVTDMAGVLGEDTRAAILAQAQALHTASGAQLAVLTVPNLGGTDIRTYAHETATRWKLGDAAKNNGLLLLLSVGDRKVRVEVGYGLEGPLPDAKVGRLIDKNAIPAFKNNDFDAGILALYNALAAEVRTEYGLPAPEGASNTAPASDGDDEGSAWAALLMFVLLGLFLLLLVVFVGMIAEGVCLVWRKCFPKKKPVPKKKGFFLMRWFWLGLYVVTFTGMGENGTTRRRSSDTSGGSSWPSGGSSGGSGGGGGSFGGGGSDRGF